MLSRNKACSDPGVNLYNHYTIRQVETLVPGPRYLALGAVVADSATTGATAADAAHILQAPVAVKSHGILESASHHHQSIM